MTSPFITSADAATYLLFLQPNGQPDLVRLHQFLGRYRLTIRTVKRGRSVLIDKASLDAHLERQSAHPTRRRKASLQPVSSRRVKRDRSFKGSDVSPQDVGVRHAEKVDDAGSIEQCHSVVGAR